MFTKDELVVIYNSLSEVTIKGKDAIRFGMLLSKVADLAQGPPKEEIKELKSKK